MADQTRELRHYDDFRSLASVLSRLIRVAAKLEHAETHYRGDRSRPDTIILPDFDIIRASMPDVLGTRLSLEFIQGLPSLVGNPRKLRLLLARDTRFCLPLGTLSEAVRYLRQLGNEFEVLHRQLQSSLNEALDASARSAGHRAFNPVVRAFDRQIGTNLAELIDRLYQVRSKRQFIDDVFNHPGRQPIEDFLQPGSSRLVDETFARSLDQLSVTRPTFSENNLNDAINLACCVSIGVRSADHLQHTQRVDPAHPLPLLISDTRVVRELSAVPPPLARQFERLVPLGHERPPRFASDAIYLAMKGALFAYYDRNPRYVLSWLREFQANARRAQRAAEDLLARMPYDGRPAPDSAQREISPEDEPARIHLLELLDGCWSDVLRVMWSELSCERSLQRTQLDRWIASRERQELELNFQSDRVLDELRALRQELEGASRLDLLGETAEIGSDCRFEIVRERSGPVLEPNLFQMTHMGSAPPGVIHRWVVRLRGLGTRLLALDVESAPDQTVDLKFIWAHKAGLEQLVSAATSVFSACEERPNPEWTIFDEAGSVALAHGDSELWRHLSDESAPQYLKCDGDIVVFYADVAPFQQECPELQCAIGVTLAQFTPSVASAIATAFASTGRIPVSRQRIQEILAELTDIAHNSLQSDGLLGLPHPTASNGET